MNVDRNTFLRLRDGPTEPKKNKQFFLQRADTKRWEEVDEFCYENFHSAMLSSSIKRYNGNSFVLSGGRILIEGSFTLEEASIVARIANINVYNGSSPKGLVDEPEYIQFKKGKGYILRQIGGDGQTFKAVKALNPIATPNSEEERQG